LPNARRENDEQRPRVENGRRHDGERHEPHDAREAREVFHRVLHQPLERPARKAEFHGAPPLGAGTADDEAAA
jgi:hypothetical protein